MKEDKLIKFLKKQGIFEEYFLALKAPILFSSFILFVWIIDKKIFEFGINMMFLLSISMILWAVNRSLRPLVRMHFKRSRRKQVSDEEKNANCGIIAFSWGSAGVMIQISIALTNLFNAGVFFPLIIFCVSIISYFLVNTQTKKLILGELY